MTAAAATATIAPPARTGLETVLADPALLGSARVGLVTNFTGVTRALDRSVDALLGVGIRIEALFSPEHGLRGTAQAGLSDDESIDEATGLPIVDTFLLEPDVLDDRLRRAGIDILVYDMQDVGTRFWTYASTMLDTLAAAARCGLRFVVLDRPNPLGGRLVEGPHLDPDLRSFVGRLDVPLRHGLTSGELARLFASRAAAEGASLPLEVVEVTGWDDRRSAPATGLPWVAPSPNLPTLDTAFVYAGTGLVEGTNVSEGRGTTRPFETVGAPFADARLVPHLRDQGLAGVAFREVWFQPTFHKYAGRTVRGVALHVTDAESFRPVRTGVALLDAFARLYPDDFRVLDRPADARDDEPGCALDRLWGSESLRHALEGDSKAGRGSAVGLLPDDGTPQTAYPHSTLTKSAQGGGVR